MSYVTGAHNVKSGFTIIRGNVTGNTINRADDVGGLPISYTFTNGVPTSMTLFASRNSDAHLDYDLALFVQDQWALRRLTLSLGLRFDWMSQSLGAVDNPANALFPAYSSPARDGVPSWKDLSPRLGAAYDLFGDGRTALKGGVNRYVAGGSTGVAAQFGPTANFSTTRNWTDANANFSPDCDLKNPAAQDLRRVVETCAAPTTTRAWRPSAKTPRSRIRTSRTAGSSADTTGGRVRASSSS